MIDIRASVATNLFAVSGALRKDVGDLTVSAHRWKSEQRLRVRFSADARSLSQTVVLDRPRHAKLIADIRAAGARVRLISDGDVAAAIATAKEGATPPLHSCVPPFTCCCVVPGSGVDVMMGVGGTPEGVIAAAALKCLGGASACFHPRRGCWRMPSLRTVPLPVTSAQSRGGCGRATTRTAQPSSPRGWTRTRC